MKKTRINWPDVVARAAEIVRGYETGVTLRQLFYRLVSESRIPNTKLAYDALSRHTARARREGTFPALIDRTRDIHRLTSFDGHEDALTWLRSIYRRDRTEGQENSLYVGVEKHGLVELLRHWFGDLGVPIISFGGYASQTYVDEVAADVEQQGRPAILIYAGDFDPSGMDIPRDFVGRAGCFGEVHRIALSAEQIQEYDLPPQPGKEGDPRAASFVREHGELVQVELDALPPDVLRELYSEAIAKFFDMDVYREVLEVEAAEREQLTVG